MDYEFPIIKHINDLMPAIQGDPLFIVAEKEGYTVINYGKISTPEMFPPIKSAGGSAKQRKERELRNALRRECRGIIFDSKTGELLRRPYHKFFNVNERPETMKLDLTQGHTVYDKLDGSMIVPFALNGEIVWGTKMGLTDVAEPVQQFVADKQNYIDFARMSISCGFSPIFEWCSRKQRIVLDYGAEDQLILTGMRFMHNGNYVSPEVLINNGKTWNIPVVRTFDSHDNIEAFIEYTRGLSDTEGFVIRFDDGHMAKMKCDWYCLLHKTLEHLYFEKDVLRLILEDKIDDVKAILPDDMIEKIDNYASDVYKGLKQTTTELFDGAAKLFSETNGARKDFAIAAQQVEQGKHFYFKIFDLLQQDGLIECSLADRDFEQYVIDYVKTQTGSQSKVDDNRWILKGVKWDV